jgi:hypothetical protein
MSRTKVIAFAEFRRFLNGLRFAAKRTEAAWVFHHRDEGLLVFRLYGEEEPVDERDLLSTRKFLDFRGLLNAQEFDTLFQQASTPA